MGEHAAQAVGNRQAQAQAFLGARLVAVEALELLEDHLALVFGDTHAAVPDFQAQLSAFTAHAQHHAALGVTEGVGQEVLQHPAQQLDVAVDPLPTAVHAQVDTLFGGQHAKLGGEGIEQAGEGEGVAIRGDSAVFQT